MKALSFCQMKWNYMSLTDCVCVCLIKTLKQSKRSDVSSCIPPMQGDQARNIPVETVTEEQYTDEDGNTVTRKVMSMSIPSNVTISFYLGFSLPLCPRVGLNQYHETWLYPLLLGNQESGASHSWCGGERQEKAWEAFPAGQQGRAGETGGPWAPQRAH